MIHAAITVLMVTAAQPEVVADAGDARADFLTMVAGTLPAQGLIDAAIVPVKMRGEIRAAFDFGTGDWYWMTQDIVMLGDAKGVLHWGDTGRGGLKPMGKPTSFDSKYPQAIVGSIIPDVLLWISHRYPSVVHEVHRTDVGFEVLLRLDGYSDERVQRIMIEVGDDGVVRRAWGADMPRPSPIEYNSELALGRTRVALPTSGIWRVASVDVSPTSVPGTFKPDRIESIGEIIKMNMAKSEQVILSESSGQGSSGAGAGAPLPIVSDSTGERWRWPLAGAGLTLLVVGVGALWWKRRR
ncbi:MAG: hypothetical protein IPM33_04105 [Phycisphaerales bacterium]|nr:hypothetical protein [Phycisphaerales bacterium]